MNKYEQFKKIMTQHLDGQQNTDQPEQQEHQSTQQTTSNVDQKPVVKNKQAQVDQAYANYFIVSAIREEVSINFCVDKNWELKPEVHDVEINSRIVMSPYAAKRLSVMLNKYLNQYEQRYRTQQQLQLKKLLQESGVATKH